MSTPIGWMFLSLAALFALGVSPRFARRFYPESPSFQRRLAAPALFAVLSIACFQGMALPALIATAALGSVVIIHNRGKFGAAAPRVR